MKNHTTILVLALVAALATTLVATGIVAIASSAAASDDNPGISIHAKIAQKTNCQTAGGTSPITTSCNAAASETITNSGGVIGAP